MFDTFRKDLLYVVQKHKEISFEEQVKNTCIKNLHACNNYLSIPSIARKNEQNLEKPKREKKDKTTDAIEIIDSKEDMLTSETKIPETQNQRIKTDEL